MVSKANCKHAQQNKKESAAKDQWRFWKKWRRSGIGHIKTPDGKDQISGSLKLTVHTPAGLSVRQMDVSNFRLPENNLSKSSRPDTSNTWDGSNSIPPKIDLLQSSRPYARAKLEGSNFMLPESSLS